MSYEVVNHQPSLFQLILKQLCVIEVELLVKTTLPVILQRNLHQSGNGAKKKKEEKEHFSPTPSHEEEKKQYCHSQCLMGL